MGIEIERKFLVVSGAWQASATSSALLRQGYLSSNSKATVRVRSLDDSSAVLTLKGAQEGMARPEFEYAIPIDDARLLLGMARPHTIEKRRHIVPFGGMTWEIDVFEGRHAGLVIAEVELDSADQTVHLPEWVGMEVNKDDRYFNASLSRAEAPPAVDPDGA